MGEKRQVQKSSSVCALLTGRGNNSLKDKNVLDILGHPVLYYPGKAAAESSLIERYFCSSDDQKILEEAQRLGFQSIVRPEEYARPDSQHVDCILHALRVMEQEGYHPQILIVLLANNVTVETRWIDDCIRLMQENMQLSAVVPVYQDNDHHPLRAKRMNEQGLLEMYEQNVSEKISTNRQDLPKTYFLAHNFWVLNVQTLLKGEGGQMPWAFMGHRILPYEIEESIDIHDTMDLEIARLWLEKNHFQHKPGSGSCAKLNLESQPDSDKTDINTVSVVANSIE
ncbi:MAG: CMP-N-acetylneuraminic acid synthetase [Provencibacterium sp.]|jgi:CMP-N,N'-diacetyllegionaminic acid synthase|nr:CMP-N-acetylneuraminic acid synthetase [Provencibacterium sp.]